MSISDHKFDVQGKELISRDLLFRQALEPYFFCMESGILTTSFDRF